MARRVGWGWWVAVAVVLLGLVGGAIVAWRARLGSRPGPLQQARAAYERGDWVVAAARAEERLRVAPDDHEALRLLARSTIRIGRDDQAQAAYRRLGDAAMQAEDDALLGRRLLRNGDREAALTLLERAWQKGTRDPDALLDLIALLSERDRIEEALPIARQLADASGWEARGDLIAGFILQEQGDPAAAAEALDLALRRDPALRGAPITPVLARKRLARAWLEAARPARARAALAEFDPARSPDSEIAWLLSRAWLQDDRPDEARKALEHAASFAEQHPLTRDPAPYVGSARCAECHQTQYRTEQSGRHARTFHRADSLPPLPWPEQPMPDPANPRVLHTLRHDAKGASLETRVDGRVLRALAEFAFGSDDRGLTLVGQDEAGRPRELRLSHYHDSGWDKTAGQPDRPGDPNDYLGRALPAEGVRRCLSCHTTSARAAREHSGPAAADHGIGCERCHGPGGNHLKAVAAKLPDLAIARPKRATGPQVVALCGQCHSPRGPVTRDDPASVRFQATTLTWSRCYIESAGAFSCVTCHNPHRNAETAAAFYESKCLACHGPKQDAPEPSARPSGTRPIALPEGVPRKPCPVNPSQGCLSCHMPTVRDALPHSPFTDHFIRVHREAKGATVREHP